MTKKSLGERWIAEKKAATKAAQEARTEQLRANRMNAIGASIGSIGSAFGDPSYIEDESTYESINFLQSATSGVSAGITAGIATGNPAIGAAVGVTTGVINLLSSSSRRDAAREAALKKWRAGLKKHKEQVKGQKRVFRRAEKQIEDALGEGAPLDIVSQAQADVAKARGINKASRGAKNLAAQRSVDNATESVLSLVTSTEETLLTRMDLLEDAQSLAQREIDASRSDFGSYTTKFSKELEEKVKEIEEL